MFHRSWYVFEEEVSVGLPGSGGELHHRERGGVGLLATSEAAQQVQAAVAAYRTQVNVGGTANLAMAGQIARERSLTVALRDQHMKPISGFARTRFKGVPDVAALTKGAAHLTGRRLVEAAQAMATAAAPHLDALVTGGFPPDVLTQLASAATALTTALTDRANSKVARVGATGGQKQALRTGLDAVRMLDAVIKRQFAGNDILLASGGRPSGWSRSRGWSPLRPHRRWRRRFRSRRRLPRFLRLPRRLRPPPRRR